ncbi:hypothetical protein RHSIM_Rhsim13G0158800 [Rhododendron simsii]|uniref:Gnk2-homologous domain-containing protein n=1 Tax=Rhododendron simsii TaxID=118357 RepID=A0A834FYZ5_RHOSS|nr:hypothetical protein RHSIM_Rhsim13G0158800 [Rhododendron simsii]
MSRKALFVNAICLVSLIPIIKGADPNFMVIECPNTNLSTTSTYAPNSTYRTNLNALLSNLSSNSNASNGFYKSTAGSSPPDVAYGLFLCRGDVSAVVCRDCVVYATGDTVQQCPGSKQVTIWYDECMLRYSNESMTPSILSVPGIGGALLTNTQNVTNATRLNEVLEEVMTNITDRASSDDSGKKFATAEANYSSNQSVYGLAQCTPDLSDSDCNNCLRNCISQFPSCCDAKRGGRVLFRSCNVRYEMYLFYNASAAPLPPSPVVPPPSGRKRNAIAIGLSVSASVVLVLLGSGIYCQRRRKRIAKEERENNQEVQLLGLAQARIVDDYSTDNLQGEKPEKPHDFPSVQLDLAWNIWCKGEGILELMDPLLAESCVATEVLKCIHIGLLCVQEDPADRPTMSTIVVALGSDNVTLPQPTQPAFSVGRLVLNSCQSSSNANEVSENEMTISDVSSR